MPESELVKTIKEMEEYENKKDYEKAARLAGKVGLHTRVVKYSLLLGLNRGAETESSRAELGITPITRYYLGRARRYCEQTQADYTGMSEGLIGLEEDSSLQEKKLESYANQLGVYP